MNADKRLTLAFNPDGCGFAEICYRGLGLGTAYNPSMDDRAKVWAEIICKINNTHNEEEIEQYINAADAFYGAKDRFSKLKNPFDGKQEKEKQNEHSTD